MKVMKERKKEDTIILDLLKEYHLLICKHFWKEIQSTEEEWQQVEGESSA